MTRKNPKSKNLKSRKEKKHDRKNKQAEKPYRPHHGYNELIRDIVKKLEEVEATRVQVLVKRGVVRHDRKRCPSCDRLYCTNAIFRNSYCDECDTEKYQKQIEESGGIFTGCLIEVSGKRVCQKCEGG